VSKEEKKLGKIKPKELPLDEDKRIPNKRKPKLKSLDKRTWEERRYTCPFCGGYIPPLPRPETEPKRFFWSFERIKHCPTCGAFEVKDGCPACKHNTWVKPDDNTFMNGIYSHAWEQGCGFKGRKKGV